MLKRVQLVLDTERDADLLAWLATQENRSAAIREAMRAAIHAELRPRVDLELRTLRRVLREELQRVGRVALVEEPADDPQATVDADPEAAARLDALF
jgi:hypothetical protein